MVLNYSFVIYTILNYVCFCNYFKLWTIIFKQLILYDLSEIYIAPVNHLIIFTVFLNKVLIISLFINLFCPFNMFVSVSNNKKKRGARFNIKKAGSYVPLYDYFFFFFPAGFLGPNNSSGSRIPILYLASVLE